MSLGSHFSIVISLILFQAGAPQVEQDLDSLSGAERLAALAELADFYSRVDVNKAIDYGQQALDLSETHPDPETEFAVLTILGDLYLRLDAQKSRTFADRARAHAAQRGHRGDTAKALSMLGECAVNEGDQASARALFEEALSLAADPGLERYRLPPLKGLVQCYRSMGDLQSSLEKALELESQSRAAGRENDYADALRILGVTYETQGIFELALDHYSRSLEIYERINNLIGKKMAIHNIAGIYYYRGETQKALAHYQQSLDFAKQTGDQFAVALASQNLGMVYGALSERERALECLFESLAIYRATGHQLGVANMFHYIGVNYMAMDDYQKAQDYLARSARIFETLDNPLYRAGLTNSQAQLYLKWGDASKALALNRKALAMVDGNPDAWHAREAIHLIMSDIYAARGDHVQALDHFKKFKELSDKRQNERSSEKLATLITRFDVREKEREIALLKKDKALKEADALQSQREITLLKRENEIKALQRNLWIGVVVLLSLLVFFGVYRHAKRKQLVQERRVSARFKQLDNLKDAFIANTSHELRTPLNGIIGLSESLREGNAGPVAPLMREQLDLVIQSGKRLSHLVNALLDFSKIKQRTLVLRKRPVNLAMVIRGALALGKPLGDGKDLKLESRAPIDLPLVDADEQRLRQILTNLIDNAVKFTDSGSVTVSASTGGKLATVRVADTGIGIPEESLARVFNSFEQVESSLTRSREGAGLGLAIAKRLVELHGGEISIDSQPGQGTTVAFTLPVFDGPVDAIEPSSMAADPPVARPEPERDAAGPASGRPEPDAPRILIVDDDRVNRRVVEQILQKRNYQIDQAADGFQALDRVKRKDYQLLLLDVMMPRMSGYEVCREVRRAYESHELPIVFLTAKDQEADQLEAFESGGNDFLTKPIAKDVLLARVDSHLASSLAGEQ